MFCDYKSNQKGWLSTENQPNFLSCVRVREKNKVYRTVIFLNMETIYYTICLRED